MTQINTNIELYRELFWKASEYFDNKINKVMQNCNCKDCKTPCRLDNEQNDCIEFSSFSKNAIDYIKNELGKEILERIFQTKQHLQNFACKNCGVCCNLASSQYSYEELTEKAKNGDNYATQFTKTFTPYENEIEARNYYPEFYDSVKNSLKEGENVYFYHCLKVTKDNLCSDYENRPQICRDFPDNPLVLLPKQCGFLQWKDDVEVVALFNHALIEISCFALEKLEKNK